MRTIISTTRAFSVHVGTESSMLRDYSGVIRRNATRYLVPGAILLQVSAKPKVRWNAIDSFFGAV